MRVQILSRKAGGTQSVGRTACGVLGRSTTPPYASGALIMPVQTAEVFRFASNSAAFPRFFKIGSCTSRPIPVSYSGCVFRGEAQQTHRTRFAEGSPQALRSKNFQVFEKSSEVSREDASLPKKLPSFRKKFLTGRLRKGNVSPCAFGSRPARTAPEGAAGTLKTGY